MKNSLLAGAAVTALAIGISSASATPISETSMPNLAIPDNDPVGISDTLSIASTGSIQDIEIEVAVDHTWIGDLIFELTGPDGTMITLMDRPGVPDSTFGNNVDLSSDFPILFTDAGSIAAEDAGDECETLSLAGPIGSACDDPPNYIPDDSLLGAFQNLDIMGDWALLISDNAGGDLGNFVSWTIRAEVDGEAPVPEPGTLVLLGAGLAGLGFLRRRRRA